MTIRFDKEADAVVEGPHPVDAVDRDGWAGDDETLWYLTDAHSNGRWLYLDRPGRDGRAELGILDSPGHGNGTISGIIYRKHLSPAALRSLAAALLVAAEQGEAIQAEAQSEREAQIARERACEASGGHHWGPAPYTVSHATVAWTEGSDTINVFEVCKRCGRGEWHTKPDPLGEAL